MEGESMINILLCVEKLRHGAALTQDDCDNLFGTSVKSYQFASLAVFLLAKKMNPPELQLFSQIITRFPEVAVYLTIRFPSNADLKLDHDNDILTSIRTSLHPCQVQLLQSTCKESEIGENALNWFISQLVSNTLSMEFIAVWLAIVCCYGLSNSDVRSLTFLMRDSGTIYDYRNMPELEFRKMIRRYPTGALSEKTALIMPSLISAFASEFPIATPFLVARSLGFTGGTWDKLKAIPGFKFPSPGTETIEVLRRCHAAMTVTQDDVNPADRILYQLRSVTCTIESHELILASIASKQMSVPVDRLLMDIRYGSGAFLKNPDDAMKLKDVLLPLLEDGGIPSCARLTGTDQPNGAAVGNVLEVCEAIALMSNTDARGFWDNRALTEQRNLVISLFVGLIMSEFPRVDQHMLRQEIEDKFASGKVLDAFENFLAAHDVSRNTIQQIVNDPLTLLGTTSPSLVVRSEISGQLIGIDQVRLGHTVNFELGAGGNEFGTLFDPLSGIVLRKRLGDRIEPGDVLVEIYSVHSVREVDLSTIISSSFFIEN
jgi:thymidine phosphorylase